MHTILDTSKLCILCFVARVPTAIRRSNTITLPTCEWRGTYYFVSTTVGSGNKFCGTSFSTMPLLHNKNSRESTRNNSIKIFKSTILIYRLIRERNGSMAAKCTSQLALKPTLHPFREGIPGVRQEGSDSATRCLVIDGRTRCGRKGRRRWKGYFDVPTSSVTATATATATVVIVITTFDIIWNAARILFAHCLDDPIIKVGNPCVDSGGALSASKSPRDESDEGILTRTVSWQEERATRITLTGIRVVFKGAEHVWRHDAAIHSSIANVLGYVIHRRLFKNVAGQCRPEPFIVDGGSESNYSHFRSRHRHRISLETNVGKIRDFLLQFEQGNVVVQRNAIKIWMDYHTITLVGIFGASIATMLLMLMLFLMLLLVILLRITAWSEKRAMTSNSSFCFPLDLCYFFQD